MISGVPSPPAPEHGHALCSCQCNVSRRDVHSTCFRMLWLRSRFAFLTFPFCSVLGNLVLKMWSHKGEGATVPQSLCRRYPPNTPTGLLHGKEILLHCNPLRFGYLSVTVTGVALNNTGYLCNLESKHAKLSKLK